LDDKEIRSDIFSINIGICKYSGGGMMQAPEAIADDGLFDITVIKKISKFEVIKNVKNLYDGSFIRHPKVNTYRAKKVIINSESPVLFEADGESLGTFPLSFEIIPRCLSVITGF
jgi:diacylglycerol kinase family enzyme